MTKVKYYDPETFEEKELEMDDFIIDIMNQIYTKLNLDEGDQRTPVVPKPEGTLVTNEVGNAMKFGIMRKRNPGESIAEKYTVTVSKFKSQFDA